MVSNLSTLCWICVIDGYLINFDDFYNIAETTIALWIAPITGTVTLLYAVFNIVNNPTVSIFSNIGLNVR